MKRKVIQRKKTASLYFAYGSNLNWEQLQQRCPGARFVDLALLPDHRLAFTRASNYWGGGVADVVPTPGAQVWGVIYAVSRRCLTALDQYEGYQPGRRYNAYRRLAAVVWRRGDSSRPEKVWLYQAVAMEAFIAPSRRYKEVIRQGAVSWGLPQSYITEVIDPVPCQEDLI